MDPFGSMFNDPQMIQKLAANPKTSKFLADPSFMQQLNQLKNNPSGAAGAMMGDPRMMQVLGVLMGIDMDMMGRGAPGAEGGESTRAGEAEEDVPMPE